MFAHKIIEALNHVAGDFRYPDTIQSEEQIDLFQCLIDVTIEKIEAAVKIDFGEASIWMDDELTETVKCLSAAGKLVLPYPTVWAECAIENMHGQTFQIGALFEDNPTWGSGLCGTPIWRISSGGRDITHSHWHFPVSYTKWENGSLEIGPLNESLRPLDAIEKDISTEFCIALFNGFAGLSASGVQLREVPAPEALNRKRARHGRLPIFSHHRVDIDIPGVQYRRVTSYGHGRSPRIHWRRAHLRRRAHEPQSMPPSIVVPLCIVGVKAALGFVEKDYRVRRRPPDEPRPET